MKVTSPLYIVLGDIITEQGKRLAKAKQLLYYKNELAVEKQVGFFEEHIEIGHDHPHWHYKDLASIELLDRDKNFIRKSEKNSFCVVDEFRYKMDLPNSPPQRKFNSSGCEEKTEVGVSIGWADYYPRGSSDQYIRVKDIQSGEYRLRFKILPTLMEYDIGEPVEIKIFIDKENHKAYEIQ